ncbi:Transcriptional regulator, TetR family [Streptomyces ambofaciens ATCC 23877]|uniref:Transcriptional regulator, TetR family n=1 Tax=Streptomyces ambofaciens (strain ATCC 23877 / 3486 / DSM 40053 / JCM 4204 / NBRC 12836 / NRRL B-2516) TaxID=278992 RepID=A0A0K2AYC8_STRA7|nr:TetR family transcriptional regulator [Streptomyces ambofaciens]AKZ57837.1 Transcriptional regulator, TetR family [Streptomyces ambofaciens ATCC 23877]
MTAAPSPRSRADGPRPGLRERKKTRTRQAIRAAAYGLIRERGYEATTIEQIADRAEVSPSTVFRYFPVKEDIVLTDAYDPVMAAELAARPGDEPWPAALRHALRKAMELGVGEEAELTRLRTRLLAEVPAVRSRMLERMSVTGRLLGRALADRTGLDPQGLEVRVLSMSLAGGLMEVTRYWAEHGHEEDLAVLVERALDVLEHGLPAPGKG